jgi:aromatic amino acid aminotransferase I
LRATEVETQAPSGWSQAIIMSLLSKWGTFGYVEWLSNLRGQYFRRRNWMCDALAANFLMKAASACKVNGAEGLVAFEKEDREGKRPLFSFVPPTGGMFIWARFYFASFPGFKLLQDDKACVDAEQAFEDRLWAKLATALVRFSLAALPFLEAN